MVLEIVIDMTAVVLKNTELYNWIFKYNSKSSAPYALPCFLGSPKAIIIPNCIFSPNQGVFPVLPQMYSEKCICSSQTSATQSVTS